MKKRINKRILLYLAIMVFVSLIVISSTSKINADSGELAIDATNFPDASFRQYIVDNFDIDKNNYLSNNEIQGITLIYISDNNIKSVQGIEYFTYVEQFWSFWTGINDVNLINCTGLRRVIACKNKGYVNVQLPTGHEWYGFREYSYCEGDDLQTFIGGQTVSSAKDIMRSDCMSDPIEITFNDNQSPCHTKTILFSGWSSLTLKQFNNIFTAPEGKSFAGWNAMPDGSGNTYSYISSNNVQSKKITLYFYCEEEKWKYDNYTLTFSFEGSTGNYSEHNQPWNNIGTVKKVIVEDSVTELGSTVFFENNNIESLVIGKNVSRIASSAFFGCSYIKNIDIDSENQYYKNPSGSNSIIEIVSNKIVYGNKYTIIPDGVEVIGENSFSDIYDLDYLRLPNSVKEIEQRAFYGSSIKEIYIPVSVTSIGKSAFADPMSNPDSTPLTVYYGGTENEFKQISIENGNDSLINSNIIYLGSLNDIYEINVVQTTGGAITASEHFCQSGTLVTIIATPDHNYILSNIKLDGKIVSSSTFNVTGNHTISATFVEKPGIIATGDCGLNAHFTYFNDGLLEIWGSGAMDDYNWASAGTQPWREYMNNPNYLEDITKIVIEDGITTIGRNAFNWAFNVESLEIGNSVRTIKSYAFTGLASLKELYIPGNVTLIENNAFYYYDSGNSLESIVVSQWNTKYDSRNNCNAIIETDSNTIILGCTNTVIPNMVTRIGDNAFESTGIKKFVIPEGITYIGNYAFGGSSLESITIPKSVTSIGCDIFNWCRTLESISVEEGNPKYDSRDNCNAIIDTATNTIISACKNTTAPTGVTIYGNGRDTAYSPYTVDTVIVPDGIETLNTRCIYTSSIENLYLPRSIKTITSNAIDVYSGVTNIYYAGTEEEFQSISIDEDNSFLDGSKVYYRCAIDEDNFPDKVFRGYISVNFDENQDGYLNKTEKESVVRMIISDAVESFEGIDFFSKLEVLINETNTVKKLDISQNPNIYVVALGLDNFDCQVKLPDSTQWILLNEDGVGRTEDNYRLDGGRFICYPGTLQKVDWHLHTITLNKNLGDGEQIVIGYMDSFNPYKESFKRDFVFTNHEGYKLTGWKTEEDVLLSNTSYNSKMCPGPIYAQWESAETSITWKYENNVLTISGSGPMEDYTYIGEDRPWESVIGEAKKIIVEDGVTVIGENAFAGAYSAKEIVIGNDVHTIKEYAFNAISSVTNLYIPVNVKDIEFNAFDYYDYDNNLATIVVNPFNITYDSRENCNSIIETKSNKMILACNDTVIPSSVKSIGGRAFNSCRKLDKVVIPDGVETIGGFAFGKSSIKSLVISKTVTSIASNIFYWVDPLDSLSVEEGNPVYDSRDNCNAIIETASNTIILACKNTTIPDTATAIGEWAYWSYGKVEELVIPDGTQVLESSFSTIYEIGTLYLPKSLTTVKANAIEQWAQIGTIYYEGSEEEFDQIDIDAENSIITKSNIVFLQSSKPLQQVKGVIYAKNIQGNTVYLAEYDDNDKMICCKPIEFTGDGLLKIDMSKYSCHEIKLFAFDNTFSPMQDNLTVQIK